MNGKPILALSIASFSYKYDDLDEACGRSLEHGGGFVFDCRCLPNPAHEPGLALKTGLDAEVREYLHADAAVREFSRHVNAVAFLAIRRYLDRGFSALSFAFGCTGGQHRSVFNAEQLAAAAHGEFGSALDVRVRHHGIERIAERGYPPYHGAKRT